MAVFKVPKSSLSILREVFVDILGFTESPIKNSEKQYILDIFLAQNNGVRPDSEMFKVSAGNSYIFIAAEQATNSRHVNTFIFLRPDSKWGPSKFLEAKEKCRELGYLANYKNEYAIRLKCFRKLAIVLNVDFVGSSQKVVSQPI